MEQEIILVCKICRGRTSVDNFDEETHCHQCGSMLSVENASDIILE